MKATSLNVRFPEGLKNELESYSNLHYLSMSDTVRKAIEEHIKKEKNKEVQLHDISLGDINISTSDIEILRSLTFTEFIFWLYYKREDPEKTEIDELFIQFIDLIDRMSKSIIFTEAIMTEFNKVKLELEKVLYDDGIKNRNTYYFLFSQIDQPGSFDYDELAYFMYGIRYDDENEEIIHID